MMKYKWRGVKNVIFDILCCNTSFAMAADATITVNGSVIARPCETITKTANVDMGDLYTFDFMIPGSTSKWYPVDLELRNCPIGTTSIEATFTGLDDSTGYYRNQGSAKNLHLELQDTAGNKLRNGSKKVVEVGEYSFAAIFPLRVRAISVNGRPTQGSVQAIINVTYVFM